MALVKCQECGKEISDTVKVCPNCGFKEKKSIPKNKLIIIIATVAILVCGSIVTGIIIHNNNVKQQENAKKDYEQLLIKTGGKTYIYGLVAQMRCYDIGQVWYSAIFKKRYDWDSKYYSYYDSDFNKAINNYTVANKDALLKLSNTKDEVAGDMKKLKNMPNDSYKETYDSIVEFYGVFSKLVDAATSPSGTYQNYITNYKKYSDDFEESYNKLKLLLPEVSSYKEKK